MQSPDFTILDEFDVEKYNACEDWDAKMWLIALSERAYMRHLLRPHKGGISKAPMPNQIFVDERNIYLGVAEARIKDPIPTRKTADSIARISAPSVIGDFMTTDIFKIIDIAANAEKNGLHDCKGIRFKDIEKATGRLSSTFYVKVDLNSPDAVILEKFGNWLEKTRNESSVAPTYPGPSFKDNDFKNWHSDRLLPYLDLAFWGKMSGHALSEIEMGNKLFPPDLDPDPNVFIDSRNKMKSISKKALKLVSKECALILATQCQTY